MTTERTPSNQDSAPLEPAVHNMIAGSVAGQVVQAGTIVGDIHQHALPHSTPGPRQLPAAPRFFAGRGDELAQLTAALNETVGAGATVVISAIGGSGGIGKTWLALHWAHQHVERFPDGQLFVDLRGFTPSGEPMPVAEAIRGFLVALGKDPTAIPDELDAQVGLYRSLVADRRMLILLDNARDTTQVAPLLPGHSACTVLVTSRRHLAGLVSTHGARSLDLAVLPEAEARQLLAGHLGPDRLAAEPDAVAELLECCAGLPLALSIVAARATTHPTFPLAVLADELRDHATRLDSLDAGEIPLNLRAMFSWSYDALPTEAATLFRLLGLAPGPDISVHATACLMGLTVAGVRGMLRELETAHLVAQQIPGRYRMHDLIHLYATDQAHHQTDDSCETALRRLVDFYLHTACTADRRLDPHSIPIEIDPPVAGCHPYPLPDQTAALAWLTAEHPCLLATQHLATDRGWHSAVWQLAWALDTLHYRGGHLHDNLATWQASLAAAHHLGDPAILIRAYRTLGRACVRASRPTEAFDHLGRALRLADDTGDLHAQAPTHRVLAMAWEQQGDDQRALEHATHALHLFQTLDRPVEEGLVLSMVGRYSARLGHYQQARAHCEAALTLHRRHHHREGEADTLDTLGYIAHLTGQLDQALDYYQQALTVERSRDLRYAYREADTLDCLGQTHAALGQHDQARDTWQQALQLYQTQHRMDGAHRIQHQLDDLTEQEREQPEVPDRDS